MEAHENCPSLIGECQSINQVRKLIEQVSVTDATVLILGESGTGKEVAARSIHHKSYRADAPFVPVNCGAIPDELLESELFGHEKGAFTGAVTARPGRFELAEGGTLFLDEIGDMPYHMQVKLLRVLQEQCYSRVGSNVDRKTNVRIIAATHTNLEERIAEGDFRMDLFYRLNVFPIEIASLRERTCDIPLLIDELLARRAVPTCQFDASALTSLMKYDWPGNVRELGNLIERLSILFSGKVVSAADLPCKYNRGTEHSSLTTFNFNAQVPDDGIDMREHLQSLEISMIREALDVSNWVVARSAKLLGLQRTTLVEKMRKYSIDRAVQAS